MNHYLLSVHSSSAQCEPPPPDQMQASMERISAVESELKAEGAWMVSGRLTGPDAAKVIRSSKGEIVTTDGPFTEVKEQIAGFYIIQATDLDAAMAWASKVTTAVGQPIEVRPFMGLQAD